MMDFSVEDRLEAYAKNHELELIKFLGFGSDGTVWKTDAITAIKGFERERQYDCELECDFRLKDAGISKIEGFAVPEYIRRDDHLMIIEMSVVSKPYVLDFSKVYLDGEPEHTPEVKEERQNWYLELWGPEKWETVQWILRALREHGIYYQDPKPGNITFKEDDEDD